MGVLPLVIPDFPSRLYQIPVSAQVRFAFFLLLAGFLRGWPFDRHNGDKMFIPEM
jgi:hypothetical protein